jgi:quercetin dioxygenase-like cupin family protein
VEGEMELTINGGTKVYRKGDEYCIPAKAKHSARFRSRCRTVDFFCEKDKYKPKDPQI